MKQLLRLIAFALIGILLSCGKSGDNSTTPPTTTTPQPTYTISSFSPATQRVGFIVTIKGTNFGTDILGMKVKIGNAVAVTPRTLNNTEITVEVPADATSGKITVLKGSETISAASDFTLLVPALTVSGYPDFAQIGEEISVIGDGFGTDINTVKVSFAGSVGVKPVTMTEGRIRVVVPADAQNGKVTVTVGSKSFTCDQLFSLRMSIRDFTPKTASAGETVKITGVGFTNMSDVYVYFSNPTDTPVRPTKVTSTEITAVVPANATTGLIKVTIDLGTLSHYSSDKLTIVKK